MDIETMLASANTDDAGKKFKAPSRTGGLGLDVHLPETPAEDTLRQRFLNNCGRGAACTCAVAAVTAASHLSCVWVPAAAIATAAGGVAVPSLTSLNIAFSLASTGLSLGGWYALRGKKAGKIERRVTVGVSLAGAALALGIHMGSEHRHAEQQAVTKFSEMSDAQKADAYMIGGYSPKKVFDYIIKICSDSGEPKPSAMPSIKQNPVPKPSYSVPGLDK